MAGEFTKMILLFDAYFGFLDRSTLSIIKCCIQRNARPKNSERMGRADFGEEIAAHSIQVINACYAQ